MSKLPYSVDEIPYNVMNIGEESEFLSNPIDPFDDLWPLYQGILDHNPPDTSVYQPSAENVLLAVEQQQSDIAVPQEAADKISNRRKGLKKLAKVTSGTPSSSKSSRKVTRRKGISIDKVNETGCSLDNVEEGPSSSVAKKLDHNAKERIRRMKLNSSYLALRALLPDSRRSKKRWSAPAVVDKVLKYIPELENEIQELKSKKEEVEFAANKNKSELAVVSTGNEISVTSTSTVSVTEVNQDEAIVHICMMSSAGSTTFANILEKVEDEGISVKSSSTMYVSEGRMTSHLHIQVNSDFSTADLEQKFISWLR